jgi:Tfp pilus assembly major pilin PilA
MVIAVLGAIAYPVYTKSITKSRVAEAVNLLDLVYNKQAVNYVRTGEYMADFNKIGRLTAGEEDVRQNGRDVVIKNYTMSLNSGRNCVSVTYGDGDFTLSRSYVNPGLGCSGKAAACAGLGEVVAKAEDVCITAQVPPGWGEDEPEPKECSGSAPVWEKECGGTGKCLATSVCQNGRWIPGDCQGGCDCGINKELEDGVCVDKCALDGATCALESKIFNKSACACETCPKGTSFKGGRCVEPELNGCIGEPLTQTRNCKSGCGKESRTQVCSFATGSWYWGAWSGCEEKPATTRPCDNGAEGEERRSVLCEDGVWTTGRWNISQCLEVVEPREPVICPVRSSECCAQKYAVSCEGGLNPDCRGQKFGYVLVSGGGFDEATQMCKGPPNSYNYSRQSCSAIPDCGINRDIDSTEPCGKIYLYTCPSGSGWAGEDCKAGGTDRKLRTDVALCADTDVSLP